MISNADIQAAWIAKIKTTPTVTARVPAVEVREDQWKGERFTYPNIRVKLGLLTPTQPNSVCLVFRSEVAIRVYVEQKSSKTADEIAGIVATAFWSHPFSQGGVKFIAVNLTSIEPADVPEWDENSWLSTVNLTCLVSAA